jgi:signal transduction histidine kinase
LEVKGKDELAQLAGTFNGMLTRLETAFTRQRQFVADASHELRSPLTVIKANAEYGLTDDATDSSSRTLFEKINRASDRTIRLVQSLLTLARSDAHTLPVERGTIALPTLFAEVVEEARALHPDGARIDVQAGVETLTGDRALLLQLLLNLTDNALRHTPATGTVTLSAQAEGEGVRLTVTDTGGGVAPEHLPHLTERFYRADAARSRHQGGTGLGLAICKAITEAHGGTLTVENEDGVGLRVAVMLPG